MCWIKNYRDSGRTLLSKLMLPHAVNVPRFIGSRSDCYSLLAFADSSKFIFGVVIFILNISTGSISFVMAKNRIIGKNLNSKSIPSLELQGIALAAECLVDLYEELAGHTCVNPIRIVDLQVYSDSLVALSWIRSYSIKLDKLQKVSVFVKNRLLDINEICEKHPITFSFVSGEDNPADCITRCLSYKQLMRTNYFSGPEFLKNNLRPEASRDDTLVLYCSYPDISKSQSLKRLIPMKLVYYLGKQMIIICQVVSYCEEAHQKHHFPEVFKYFDSSKRLLKDLPKIIGQLNLYIDKEGLLRVRSKLDKLKDDRRYRFPILLSKDSRLTKLIIENYHERFAHAGCYSLLSEIRKTFWIPWYFSTVKKVLKTCVTCRRFNERTIKVNQNSYRDFRVNPPEIPYRAIFVDYMGPFFVRSNNQKIKVWLLCITCTWSRAINLKLCMNMTVNEYLRAFQLHCFEYGMPELCISDMGTQLVAGANVILDSLKDPEVNSYFEENGIKPIQFHQFFKGNSALGSMVESCVKLTKKLIYGAIRNNVLEIRDFEFLIGQTIHIVNRRPIAFKEALRETDLDTTIPEPITPESLLKGYDLVSVNVIPPLQQSPDLELDDNFSLDLTDRVRDNFVKLRKVRQNLIEIYHSEFITSLLQQCGERSL
ncbi:uncharacterized protein LOC135204009 [Macrobrachium nipponense]|uniref:uncharacterized protein LOC135204009 n=1 Tax=Macrobrachium nipponense TaxID=159736 RepID=UPI0030C8306A